MHRRGPPAGSACPAMTPADLARRVIAEIDRLQTIAGTMAPASRAIARARFVAGLPARFAPSPEATLARRYEAARNTQSPED